LYFFVYFICMASSCWLNSSAHLRLSVAFVCVCYLVILLFYFEAQKFSNCSPHTNCQLSKLTTSQEFLIQLPFYCSGVRDSSQNWMNTKYVCCIFTNIYLTFHALRFGLIFRFSSSFYMACLAEIIETFSSPPRHLSQFKFLMDRQLIS